jgi:ERCC4-type nuclease
VQFLYKYTDTEIKKLLKEKFVIVVDTREQQNQHILDFFNKHKIKYEVEKVDAGDYTAKVLPCPEKGIHREFYGNVTIEKKNSIDELASSFKERTRFENEFIRAFGKKTKTYLLVEDSNGYKKILKGDYRSEYDRNALMGSLKAFEARYNFATHYCDKELSGDFIYRTLYYFMREELQRYFGVEIN